MSANDFNEDLNWSEAQHSQDWWSPYYKKAFPRLQSVSSISGNCPAQKAGIDKIITLEGGKHVYVDEKIRREREPTDILIEYEHIPTDDRPSWPGWVEKPNQFTDYLAFGFCKFRTAFFLPFVPLQSAWLENKENWIGQFKIARAPNPKINPRYFTISCCVPTETLLGHLLCAMRIRL